MEEKRERPRYTLEELLAGFDPEKHRHPLYLDDKPVGREFPNGCEYDDWSDLVPQDLL